MRDDLISRQAAIDIAFRSPFFSDSLMEELRALPAAQPKEKTGQWVKYPDCGCFKCSECGMPSLNRFKYCCGCGQALDWSDNDD